MKKKSLIGIIAGVVLVPVVACAILLNFKGVGIEDNSVKRDLAEIKNQKTVSIDDDAIALAASSDSDAGLRNIALDALDAVNAERAAYGLGTLKWNGNLESAASVRAQECELSFSHTRPNGESCFSLYPTDYWVVGENIVMVPVGSRTAVEVAEYMMDLWMNSPGHRANILKDGFTAISVGVAIKDGYAFGVQNFIDRRDTSTYAEP